MKLPAIGIIASQVTIPDLYLEALDIWTGGDLIVPRGEAGLSSSQLPARRQAHR